MSYPKPLSEEALKKRYDALGLDEEQLAFIKKLFLACANRCGALYLDEIFDVYDTLTERISLPVIDMFDIAGFADVARRADVPYYVLDVSDIVPEAKDMDDDWERLVVNRELVLYGRGKYNDLDIMMQCRESFDGFIPDENLFLYAEGEVTLPEEKELYDAIAELKVTYPLTPSGRSVMGKKLGSFITDLGGNVIREKFRKPDPVWGSKIRVKSDDRYDSFSWSQDGRLRDKAYQIVRYFMYSNHITAAAEESICLLFDAISLAGAAPDEKMKEKIMELAGNLFLNQPMWCLYGNTPKQIMDLYPDEEDINI